MHAKPRRKDGWWSSCKTSEGKQGREEIWSHALGICLDGILMPRTKTPRTPTCQEGCLPLYVAQNLSSHHALSFSCHTKSDVMHKWLEVSPLYSWCLISDQVPTDLGHWFKPDLNLSLSNQETEVRKESTHPMHELSSCAHTNMGQKNISTSPFFWLANMRERVSRFWDSVDLI